MTEINGVIVPGHGIASGKNGFTDVGGTINAQRPFFKELGFDMDAHNLFMGTINVNIKPLSYTLTNPVHKFEMVDWTPIQPPETFSLCECQITFDGKAYNGFVYYPHPETKPIEFLGHNMLEILAPKIPNIEYGRDITLSISAEQMSFTENSDAA